MDPTVFRLDFKFENSTDLSLQLITPYNFQLKIAGKIVKKSYYEQSVVREEVDTAIFNHSGLGFIDNVRYLNCRSWFLKLIDTKAYWYLVNFLP